MKKVLTTLIAVFSVCFIYAQIASSGTPPSFTKNMTKAVETHQLPKFDVSAMLAEDEMTKGEGPLRFGKRHKVNLTPKSAGTWEKLANGDRIWRITFTSKGAYSLNFLFSKFYMPDNAKLYAYNTDKSDVRGAFTALNNKSDGMFAITPIEGETVTLEYFKPATVRRQGVIEISYVVHAYRNLHSVMDELLEKDYGDSGACNNDVACPESAGWEDQIRSVALIIDDGFRACTGAMVNNAAQDGTPYFLSANHCGIDINSNWTFVFNYNSPTCDGPDGNLDESIVGGQLRANYGPSDFSLFELSMPPPPDYTVYYAGWNNMDVPAFNCTAIHHPAGDVKKISFNDDPLFSGTWGTGGAEIPGGNHWIIGDWEDGTTEGGSSGSPVFDHQKLIVGQLHGGGASCDDIIYDSYGKFSASWTGGGTPSTRLMDWLGEGRDTLHGAYFIDPPLALDIQAVNILGISNSCPGDTLSPQLIVRNIGSMGIGSFTVNYSYDGGTTQSIVWTGTPISFYGSVVIDLPPIVPDAGTHTFDASVALPNGLPDDDMMNNTANTSSFKIIDDNILTINLTTDNFPAETSYEITDQSTGEIIYTSIGFSAAQLNINDYCLEDGCYTFTIFDSYGDGICCSYGDGSYEVVEENGTIVGTGSEFETQESLDFCLPFALTAQFNIPEQTCKEISVTVENTSQVATSFSWSAPGADVETSTEENPTFTYSTVGTYTITLSTGNDTDTATYSQTIEVTEDNGFIVNLTTDTYPAETSFQIADQAGNTLYLVSLFEPSQLNINAYCLPNGCYTFTIFDAFEDGICCGFGQGSYELLDVNGNTIGSGGEFLAEESINFCLPFSNTTAGAGFDIESACAGEAISITNTSQNTTTYTWLAPSATPESSNDASPTFVYEDAGDYTITLIASNDIGSDTLTQDVTIYPLPQITEIIGENSPLNGSTETYSTPLTAGSSYQWRIEGGMQISGGNTNSIEVMWDDPNNSAYLCVTETSAEGCTSSELCYDVLTQVGIEDIAAEKGLLIFPNPSDGLIYIKSNEAPDALDVYDVMGRQIDLIYQNNTIDLSQQASGIYLIRITYEEGSVTRRILVE